MKNYLLITLILFSGCYSNSNKPKPKIDYKVSVEANGQKTTGNTEKLINRVLLKDSQIVKIFGTEKKPRIPPEFYEKKVSRNLAKVVVNRETKFTKALNLRYGDIITAIDTNLVNRIEDLQTIPVNFKNQTEVSIHFQRNSKLMKTILYKSK